MPAFPVLLPPVRNCVCWRPQRTVPSQQGNAPKSPVLGIGEHPAGEITRVSDRYLLILALSNCSRETSQSAAVERREPRAILKSSLGSVPRSGGHVRDSAYRQLVASSPSRSLSPDWYWEVFR